jgi:1-acyl-sn-glycerol-3-phosphate acyltransferase
MKSSVRLAYRIAALILLTVTLLPVQVVAVILFPPLARRVPTFYHRLGTCILSVAIRVQGAPSPSRPLLIVANHVSWLDISVITATGPVSFIAKREVRNWPVFGLLARLQRSIFIDRERRQKSGAANSEIADRLLAGDEIVLFAEGTSSDGKDVLPFRSTLIGAAAQACERLSAGTVFIQPLSIVYNGEGCEIAPWHGDMDLLPHLVRVLRAPKLDVVLHWGESVPYFVQSDRKQIAKKLEGDVRALMRRTQVQCAEDYAA